MVGGDLKLELRVLFAGKIENEKARAIVVEHVIKRARREAASRNDQGRCRRTRRYDNEQASITFVKISQRLEDLPGCP